MANQIMHHQTSFNVGDLIKVFQTVEEKGKERVQAFEGKVISIKGRSPNQTFTVRRIGVDKVSVEKIFPLLSPSISKIEIKKKQEAKRAKLYYLRKKIGQK